MLPGRYLFLCMIVLQGTMSVPARSEVVQVVIDQLVFSPQDVTAKVGDTIEWTNKDVLAHTATVRGDWDVMIGPGSSARLDLKAAGTFAYYCRFHPNMKGRIIVLPK